MGDLLADVLRKRRAQAQGGEDEDEHEESNDSDNDFGTPLPTPQVHFAPLVLDKFSEQYRDFEIPGGSPKQVVSNLKNNPMLQEIFTESQIEQVQGTLCLGCVEKISPEDLKITLTVWNGNALNFNVRFKQGYMDINVICEKSGNAGKVNVVEIHRHRTEITDRGELGGNLCIPLVTEQVTSAAKMTPVPLITSDSIRNQDSNAFGYNVWPKMGFDAPVPPGIVGKMYDMCDEETFLEKFAEKDKEGLAKKFLIEKGESLSLSDLFLQEGVLYEELCFLWLKCGDTISTVFDVTPGSKSFKVLEKYSELKKKK